MNNSWYEVYLNRGPEYWWVPCILIVSSLVLLLVKKSSVLAHCLFVTGWLLTFLSCNDAIVKLFHTHFGPMRYLEETVLFDIFPILTRSVVFSVPYIFLFSRVPADTFKNKNKILIAVLLIALLDLLFTLTQIKVIFEEMKYSANHRVDPTWTTPVFEGNV